MHQPVPGNGLILSLGSVNIDIAAYSRSLPRPGQTIHARRSTVGLGGKGANQAAAASRLAGALGLEVALVGRIGGDPFGPIARTALERFGVDLSCLRVDPAHPTGLALIGIDDVGENAITVSAGANMALDHTDLAAAATLLDRARVLLLQLEVPLGVSLAAAARARLVQW